MQQLFDRGGHKLHCRECGHFVSIGPNAVGVMSRRKNAKCAVPIFALGGTA